MEPITKVQFRKDKGGVFAVFPYIIDSGTNVSCYMHVGQHGGCSWDVNYHSKPATPKEYKPLLKELKSIGYRLQVIKRRSHKEYLKAYYATLKTT